MANYIIMLSSFLVSLMVPAALTHPKYRVTWATLILPVIGLVAFFAYMYIFNVNIQEIIAKVQGINVRFYVLAAIASVFDTLFFSLAWHSLLKFLSVKISLLRSFLFVWVGIFVDTMIPAESVTGEISKIYLVNREQNGAAGKATASVVAQRLIGMSINIATLSIGAVLLLTQHLLQGMVMLLILFLVVVTFVLLALILLLCRKENWTIGIVEKLIHLAERMSRGRWKLTALKQDVIDTAKAFHSAIRDYAHAPKTLFVASSFSVISWMFALAIFYFTFLAVGYTQISWSAILVTSGIFVAVKSLPIGIPFEVGLPEITLTTLLILFGVPPEIGATGTILMRLLTLWMRFFIGFAAQEWIGIRAMTTSKNVEANVPQE